MPIPGGFGTPPTVSVLALATPSPGVQVTVTNMDVNAATITVWRVSASYSKVAVRGASNTLVAGPFTVDDFEAPLGEQLTYSAVTYDSGGVPSDESDGTNITLVSTSTWISDPLIPTSAITVRIGDFPERTREIDAEFMRPIGSDTSIMVAGQRARGSGQLMLVTTTLDDLNDLRGVLMQTPLILIRAPYASWDLGSEFLGFQNVSEKRIGPLAEPTRQIVSDIVYIQRPVPEIAGPLHTYAELAGKGYSYTILSAADLTYLQLAQRGGL